MGLTGGIASGKTTISLFLKESGIPVINADEIGHKVILKEQKAYLEIVNYFGNEILNLDTKEIDRKKLGDIVFSDNIKLEKLNKITHKYIKEEIKNRIKDLKSQNYKIIVIEMAILIEAKFQDLVDEIWLVYSPTKERIKRLIKRNNISLERAQKIIEKQAVFSELKPFATHIINNYDINLAIDYVKNTLLK